MPHTRNGRIGPTRHVLWSALALALGLALRLWFIVHDPRIAGDTFVYGGIAKNWLLNNTYGWLEHAGVPQPTLIRLPGYPLFLMLCFRLFGMEHYTAVLYTHAAIDLIACLLVSDLAGRLFGPKARLTTLWLAALCPFTAGYVAAALTETLTLACMIVAFYALQRWYMAGTAYNHWLFLVAAALAYSILLRPEQGLLAIAVLPAMLYIALRPRTLGWPIFCCRTGKSGLHRILPIFVAAFLTILPLLPWTLRNYKTFHVFQPLAPRQAVDPGEFVPLGFERWYRTWAIDFASTEDVYWNYDGAGIQFADLPARAFDTADQRARTAALLDDYNRTTTATPAFDAQFNDLAKQRIAGHTFRYYAALPAARLLNMTLRPRTEMFAVPLEWWRYREHPRDTLFAALYGALNLAYLVLAAWGVFLWHRTREHRWLLYAMLASITLRAALLLTLDNSEPRYTLEFFPVVILLAALPFTGPSRSSSYPS